MVNTRIDGQPIAFSGQTVSYDAGVANTINERIFVDPNQNLTTGLFDNRGCINITDGMVEVSSTNGTYSPKVY